VLLVALGLTAALPAHAAVYWTVPQVMKSFFASSKKIGFRRVTLTDAAAAQIAKKLGQKSIKKEWTIYVAERDGKRDGYAVVDEEKGMHELIDYAVRFSPRGSIERIEIMVYREPYGDEVRRDRFRDQFRGKTADDPIVAGHDIDIISGASISSRSIALGVKRDTLVLDAAIKSGSL
jgi:Na+-translocating ferredoxin:NAD+ oxidoreductase subunit G